MGQFPFLLKFNLCLTLRSFNWIYLFSQLSACAFGFVGVILCSYSPMPPLNAKGQMMALMTQTTELNTIPDTGRMCHLLNSSHPRRHYYHDYLNESQKGEETHPRLRGQ